MKISVIICILLCASIISNSQNSLSLTDELIQCERGYFESTDPVEQNTWLLKKAFVYHTNGEYLEALNTYDRLRYEMLGDSLLSAIFLKMAANAYLLGNFEEAIAYCSMIPENEYHKYVIQDATLIKILSLNNIGDYVQSRQVINSYISALKISSNQKDSLQKVFNTLYSSENLPHYRDPSRAELLSTIIPGLGQSYSGYYAEGVGSFLTHIIIAGLTGYATYHAYYLTAYFGGVNLFMKFYFGNPTRAAYLANKRNYQEQRKFASKVRDQLDQLKK